MQNRSAFTAVTAGRSLAAAAAERSLTADGAAAGRSLTAAAASGRSLPPPPGWPLTVDGAAAAADRQLSLLPPHCALQPPVGAPPPPIDRLSPPPRGLVSKSYCLTSLAPEKKLPAGL